MTPTTMGRRTVGWRVAVTLALPTVWGITAAAAAPAPPAGSTEPGARGRPPAKRTIVDHAVVPAGGAICPHCPGGKCRHGQGHQRPHGHHADCRHGQCVPYCPVRPSEFGFYGTQWRRWPGQGVVPVSAEEDATPVLPPRSEVPGAEDESPQRRADGPSAAADDLDATEPAADPAADDPLPSSPPVVPEAPEPLDDPAAADG